MKSLYAVISTHPLLMPEHLFVLPISRGSQDIQQANTLLCQHRPPALVLLAHKIYQTMPYQSCVSLHQEPNNVLDQLGILPYQTDLGHFV